MQHAEITSLMALKKCGIFSQVSPDALAELADHCPLRSLKAASELFSTGQKADGFYIVASGQVEVYRSIDTGREQNLHILGPGEVCGSVPVFQGACFPASARMKSDGKVLYVPGRIFLDQAFSNPQMLLDMLAVMSERLRQFAAQVENLSLRDVPQRLLAYLKEHADSNGFVKLDCTKTELATRLGTVPETLSRALNKLTRSGEILDNSDPLRIKH